MTENQTNTLGTASPEQYAAPHPRALGPSILKNYSFLAICYAVSRFVAFLALAYLARTLGVQHFGEINFAQAVVVYFTLATHLGLMTFGTRAIASGSAQMPEMVSKILPIRLVLAAGSYVLLALFSFLVPFSAEVRLLTLLFGIALFSGAAILDWAFKGVQRMVVVGIMEILRYVPFLVLVSLWVRGSADLYRVPLFWFISSAAAAVFGLSVLLYRYGTMRLTLDWNYAWQALRQALPLGVAFIMVQVYYLIDTIMLGVLKEPVEVGLYSAAYRMITFPQGFGGWYFETVFPVLSRLYRQERHRLTGFLSFSTRLTALAIVPLAVWGTFFAAPLLRLFFGPDYAGSAVPLQILIWAISVELVGMNFGYSLMACEREKDYLKAVSWGAATSVLLNLLLIPRLGIQGAALARGATEILIAALCWNWLRRTAGAQGLASLRVPVLGGGLMALCLMSLSSRLLGSLTGFAVYFLVVFVISPGPRRDLRAFLEGEL